MYLQLIPKTGAGAGKHPVTLTVLTMEDIPGNVKIASLSSTAETISVSWNAPAMPNGRIIGYRYSLDMNAFSLLSENDKQ